MQKSTLFPAGRSTWYYVMVTMPARAGGQLGAFNKMLNYSRSMVGLVRIGRALPYEISPRPAASRMRAAVFVAWVLAMMFWRWVSTVRLLAKSFSAISPLVRPSATSLSTSSSRAVRSAPAGPLAASWVSRCDYVTALYSILRPISVHGNGCPAATVRIA